MYINTYNCLCEQAMSNKSKSNKGFVVCNVNMSWLLTATPRTLQQV